MLFIQSFQKISSQQQANVAIYPYTTDRVFTF